MTQREEREENMQRVVWAAQALFIKQGVAATTISQIAREVRLSEMSIYRYFQNKGNLVERVWRESLTIFFKEFMEELEREVNDGMTGLEQFGVCMDLYIRYYTQFPEFLNYTREMFVISNQNMVDGHYSNEKFWSEFYAGIPQPILVTLRKAQKDGSIRKDVNIYEVYQLFHNIYTGTTIYSMFDQGVDDMDIFRFTKDLLISYIKAD